VPPVVASDVEDGRDESRFPAAVGVIGIQCIVAELAVIDDRLTSSCETIASPWLLAIGIDTQVDVVALGSEVVDQGVRAERSQGHRTPGVVSRGANVQAAVHASMEPRTEIAWGDRPSRKSLERESSILQSAAAPSDNPLHTK
jgi:hypothetical protein